MRASVATAAVAACLLLAPTLAVRFQDVPGPAPSRGFVGYIAGQCRYRNASLTGCCGWLLDGSADGSNVSMFGDAPGEGADSPHCTGENPAFASYIPTVQSYKCISATEGVVQSKPLPGAAYDAYFCNRYKVFGGGTKVKLAASEKLGSFPKCPDAVLDTDDIDAAPALVSSVGTYTVVEDLLPGLINHRKSAYT